MPELAADLIDGANAAAEYSGLQPRMIYHLAKTGQIPCTRMGRRLYFRKSELDRAFSSAA